MQPKRKQKVRRVPHRTPKSRRQERIVFVVILSSILCTSFGVEALGEQTRVEIRGIRVHETPEPRPSARRRLAWEVRKRTSIDTHLQPRRSRLDDPSLFETPFLYWSGDRSFEPLSEAEIVGLRRYIEFGGFILIDDAEEDARGFEESIRRALSRAFHESLHPLPSDHTIYRSFYLLERPVGRVRGPPELYAMVRTDRVAIVYSRHDLGGAWARDNLGNWQHFAVPGGETQRENAIRLGVNLLMYALCLDYKDDQVHAPFIMRRRSGVP